MRKSFWLAGALALFSAGSAQGDPYFASNAADFSVPADELDATAIGQAAVHSGFFPLSENDAKLKELRAAPDPVYEIWEPRAHNIASITLTRLKKSGAFVVVFVAKDPSRRGAPLAGEACKKWLKFSAAMRTEFGPHQSKFRFRNPQCEP